MLNAKDYESQLKRKEIFDWINETNIGEAAFWMVLGASMYGLIDWYIA